MADAPVLLVMDFAFTPSAGPAGQEGQRRLAQSIAAGTPGFLWKIWTRDVGRGRCGGVYAFDSRAAAEAYQAIHTPRVLARGGTDIQAVIWGTRGDLGVLTRAPLP